MVSRAAELAEFELDPEKWGRVVFIGNPLALGRSLREHKQAGICLGTHRVFGVGGKRPLKTDPKLNARWVQLTQTDLLSTDVNSSEAVPCQTEQQAPLESYGTRVHKSLAHPKLPHSAWACFNSHLQTKTSYQEGDFYAAWFFSSQSCVV